MRTVLYCMIDSVCWNKTSRVFDGFVRHPSLSPLGTGLSGTAKTTPSSR